MLLLKYEKSYFLAALNLWGDQLISLSSCAQARLESFARVGLNLISVKIRQYQLKLNTIY